MKQRRKGLVKFDVVTAVKIYTVVLRVMTPDDLVGGYQCFGGILPGSSGQDYIVP
jgi:hypothetical protein